MEKSKRRLHVLQAPFFVRSQVFIHHSKFIETHLGLTFPGQELTEILY
jgi:hypothetical protein